MKFNIDDRVLIAEGVEGKVITLPPGKGSEIYVVLLDNGRGILVPVAELQEIENDDK